MNDQRTDPPPETLAGDYEKRTAALAAISTEYPGWVAWPGVINLLYARRARSSPPMVVRSTTEEGLRRAIEDAERERGLRP